MADNCIRSVRGYFIEEGKGQEKMIVCQSCRNVIGKSMQSSEAENSARSVWGHVVEESNG